MNVKYIVKLIKITDNLNKQQTNIIQQNTYKLAGTTCGCGEKFFRWVLLILASSALRWLVLPGILQKMKGRGRLVKTAEKKIAKSALHLDSYSYFAAMRNLNAWLSSCIVEPLCERLSLNPFAACYSRFEQTEKTRDVSTKSMSPFTQSNRIKLRWRMHSRSIKSPKYRYRYWKNQKVESMQENDWHVLSSKRGLWEEFSKCRIKQINIKINNSTHFKFKYT